MRSPDLVVDRVLDDPEATPPCQTAGRRHRGTRRRQRDGRDRGFTLVETVIGIGLMGTVVLVIISGIFSVIRVSSTSDDAARVEAMLTSAADRLAGWTYLSCPLENDQGYDAIVEAAAADVSWTHDDALRIIEILFWDPTAQVDVAGVDENAADGDWNTTNNLGGSAACGEDVNFTTSRTLQRITIQATSPDGKIVRQLQVVKSNVGDRIETP